MSQWQQHDPVPVLFHLYNNVFQHLFFILVQMKTVENQGITFCQFGSGKRTGIPASAA